MMNRSHWTALALALAACLPLVAHAGADEAIKYRRNLMDANGGLMGACNAVLLNKVGDKARLAGYAQALAHLNQNVAGLFPSGSQGPDSDALPEVWSRRADFERLAHDAEARSATFAKAASGHDAAATTASFKALSEACKGCHKDFRK